MFDSYRPFVAPMIPVCVGVIVGFGLLVGPKEAHSSLYVEEVAAEMPFGLESSLASESVDSASKTFTRLAGESNAVTSSRRLLVSAGIEPSDDPVARLGARGVDTSALRETVFSGARLRSLSTSGQMQIRSTSSQASSLSSERLRRCRRTELRSPLAKTWRSASAATLLSSTKM